MAFTSSPRRSAPAVFLRMLAVHLHDLTLDLSEGGYTQTTLAMLDHDLRRSVASSLGCTVQLDVATLAGVTPLRLHLVDRTVEPHEIAAVLSIPLGPLVPEMTGWVSLYAGEAGAFDAIRDDLAALELDQHDPDPHDLTQHDLREPPPPSVPVVPGLAGLQDFSVLNRALGVLIHRGHSLEQARVELRRRAAQASSDLTSTAQAVLRSAHY